MEKEKNNISRLSFILFIIVMTMLIFAIFVDTTGFLIAGVLWVGILPFMISNILAIISIIAYFKDKKDCKTTKSRTILTSINIVQLILCIVLIFNFESFYESAFELRTTINFTTAKKELNKLYSNNYEIIDTYYNSGGSNEIIAIIKLKNENMYSLVKYDIRDNEFIDYYSHIKKGEQLELNKYFDKDFIGVASSKENLSKNSAYDNELQLICIVNYNDYGIEKLTNNLINIADDYILNSEENSVNIRMFFTDNIDYSKMDEYKLLLTSQLEQGFCNEELFEKYNNKLVYENYYDYHFNSSDLENQENLEEAVYQLTNTIIENGIE